MGVMKFKLYGQDMIGVCESTEYDRSGREKTGLCSR